MIAYGIGMLPLIKNLNLEIPDVIHPCYSDGAGALGMSARLETYFYLLTHQGLGWEYHPEPTKIVLIVRMDNLKAVKVFRIHRGSKVCTGARYMGVCIG